jgi:hypothetical protein
MESKEAAYNRGELGGDRDGGGMADTGKDDPSQLMTDRQRWGVCDQDAPPSWRLQSMTTVAKDKDVAEVVHDNEWSLTNAVLLYSTSDHARWILPNLTTDRGGWMEAELEAEQANLLY